MLNEVIYRRVVKALPAKLRNQLNKIISSKLSNSAVGLYTGDLSSQYLHSVFKYSLHFILNDAEPKLMQHLIFILMDLNTLQTSTKENVNSKSVKLNNPVIKQNSQAKNLVKSKEKGSDDQESPISMEIPSFEHFSNKEPASLEADPQSDSISEDDILTHLHATYSVTSGATPPPKPTIVKSSDRKRSTRQPPRTSTVEDQDYMKRKREAASLASNGTQPAATPKRVRPPVATEAPKTQLSVEQVLSNREKFIDKWVDLPPASMGIECDKRSIKECHNCIRTLLLAPVTACNAEDCYRVEHSDGIFVHHRRKLTKIHEAHISKIPGFIEQGFDQGQKSQGLFTSRFAHKRPPISQMTKILDKEISRLEQ